MTEGETKDRLLVGVEEEFILIDAETKWPTPRIANVMPAATSLAGDQAQEELHQAQIEHATSPCDSLDQLRTELIELRAKFVQAARSEGALVVAAGTFPGQMGEGGRRITAKDRYQEMARANSILAHEQLICGCHIHVSITSPERAISVMNRIRAWLPYISALSANSPFWEGEDTGFASYRTEIWSRWPTSGPPGYFETLGDYERLLEQLVESEVILDKKMAYWDVRPSEAFPTIEIRVNDVMSRIDDIVAVTGIVRGLVAACDEETEPVKEFRWELLRAANWRAARSGLSSTLLSPVDGLARPAREAIEELLAHIAPVLDRRNESAEVGALTRAILNRGNGATRQRAAFERRNQIVDVIDAVTLQDDGHPGDLRLISSD
jgi:glutamate---cysteine ligase / carboxylate-amine ligase